MVYARAGCASTVDSTAGGALSIGTELEDRGGLVDLPGPQHRRREVRVVRRVRVVLGLEGEAVTLAVHPATGAHQRAVEEVAGVELDARLVGVHAEHPAAGRLADPGGQRQPGSA